MFTVSSLLSLTPEEFNTWKALSDSVTLEGILFPSYLVQGEQGHCLRIPRMVRTYGDFAGDEVCRKYLSQLKAACPIDSHTYVSRTLRFQGWVDVVSQEPRDLIFTRPQTRNKLIITFGDYHLYIRMET